MSKKPGIPLPSDISFPLRVKECLERVMGRIGGFVSAAPGPTSSQLSIAPTAADFNALRADHEALRAQFNALLSQLQDKS